MQYELNGEQEKAIEKGREDITNGRFYTTEKVIAEMRVWLLNFNL